ncbi:agrin-like isoform X2 [Anneissia japonica]|uniref:agrin-like isoform X2 n=1 Tax=Anneissia japonica TaxID=1529436 RepID=UPI0014257CEA|nr:agrin-like isoform X2 [Anneissia japonica]
MSHRAMDSYRECLKRCNRILEKCPRKLRSGPVCGSDGRTYSSECKLLKKACKKGRNLQKQHDGTCGVNDVIQYTYKVNSPYNNYDSSDSEEDVWPEIQVRFDRKHVLQNGTPSNMNNKGGKGGNRPISNGRKRGKVRRRNRRNRRKYVRSSGENVRNKKYDNESTERRHRKPSHGKRRHTHIPPLIPTQQHDPPTTKPIGTTLTATQVFTSLTASITTVPSPNCKIYCSPFLPKAQLCASNGKTYSSLCDLERDACIQKDLSIAVEYDGPCRQAEGRVHCPQYCPLVFQPVCGNNGKTYPSSCWLNAVSCKEPGIKLSEVHTGRCETNIQVKDPDRPICKRTCPTEFKRVCGSDGITYANECLLKLDSCKDPGLTVVMRGPCPPTDSDSRGLRKHQ